MSADRRYHSPPPVFSIVMATYNRRDLLPRSMQSVLSQSFPHFEILVIDNGSTDDTASIVERIEDSRIRYIRNPSPTDTCDAPRNLGIKMARGALIAFLDDDDIWYPGRLDKVKRVFDENPAVGAVCHSENRRVNGRIDRVLGCGPWTENLYEALLYDGNRLSSCGTTIKADLLRELGGFLLNEEFYTASDYDLWLRMAAKGVKIHFIQEPLGEFSWTGNNVTSVNPVIAAHVAHLIKGHIVSYEKKPLLQSSDRALWRLFQLYAIAARSFRNARDYKKAVKYYLQALGFLAFRCTLFLRLIASIRQRLLPAGRS